MNLKEKLVTTLLLVGLFQLVSFHAHSQHFYGGIQAGVVGSQVNGDEMSGFDKTGLIAGALIDYTQWKRFWLTLELDYIQKGSQKKPLNSTTEVGSWDQLKVNYLEIPIIATYKLPLKFEISLGLACGIKVSESMIDSFYRENPHTNLFKDYDLSALIGVNYELLKNLIVGIRLESSFINLGR